jgi:hypothetical protein
MTKEPNNVAVRRNGLRCLNRLMFLLLFTLFCFPLSLAAKVTGKCVNCHTMHNSQAGQPMAYDFDGTSFTKTATPKGSLLIYDCIGCHSATNGTTWQDSITKAPIVFNTVAPTYNTAKGLAGGNFYYMLSDDIHGHNVLGIKAQDPTLGLTPPGGSALTTQLRCAGTWGCHGHNGRQPGDTVEPDQTKAMKGGHHGDDTPPLGSLTDVAKNYRFLLGITGKEDTDWEKDNINTSHNEYQGATSFGTNTTISYLCGECHGNFHSSAGVGSVSPWLRHPTDAVLKSSGEYSAYTIYSTVAPVARPNPDSVPDTTKVTPGTDIVMCVSCHRAHASPYFKMIRWDYKSSTFSIALEGCNVCHTSKN